MVIADSVVIRLIQGFEANGNQKIIGLGFGHTPFFDLSFNARTVFLVQSASGFKELIYILGLMTHRCKLLDHCGVNIILRHWQGDFTNRTRNENQDGHQKR